jgi:hypothetical protein
MKPFDGFTQEQMQDLYFNYAAYRDAYCRANGTCCADIGIVEFYS